MQLAPSEEPQLDPNQPLINHSPPPLLLPSSDFVAPTTANSLLPPVQSIVLHHEETIRQPEKYEEEEEQLESDEENEKENQLGAPSTLAVPLSPTMPLNATYLARRSIPAVTALPTNLLSLSSIMVPNTTIGNSRNDSSFQSPTCPPTTSFQIQPNRSIIVAPVSLAQSRTHVDPRITIATTTPVQPKPCTVSTQTESNDFLSHHPCHDVSECPCVGIYTRSEQLFLASMAVFFRNSIQVITPPEPSMAISSSIKIGRTTTTTTTTNAPKSQHTHVTIHQHDDPPLQATPVIEEIPSVTTDDRIEVQPSVISNGCWSDGSSESSFDALSLSLGWWTDQWNACHWAECQYYLDRTIESSSGHFNCHSWNATGSNKENRWIIHPNPSANDKRTNERYFRGSNSSDDRFQWSKSISIARSGDDCTERGSKGTVHSRLVHLIGFLSPMMF